MGSEKADPFTSGWVTAGWNEARGEGIKQDNTRWVAILRLLLATKAAFWQEVEKT